MSLVKNLLTQWEIEEENWTKDQLIKNLLINEGDGEENRKIISVDIVDKKNILTWTKDWKRKTEIGGKKRDVVWMMRDLNDKGLGQNKVLCSSSEVELPMIKLPL